MVYMIVMNIYIYTNVESISQQCGKMNFVSIFEDQTVWRWWRLSKDELFALRVSRAQPGKWRHRRISAVSETRRDTKLITLHHYNPVLGYLFSMLSHPTRQLNGVL